MALYAYDSDDVIAALDAEPSGRYWCLECSQPVKMRRGRSRVPHFYHLKLSPSCRLYSKSEDHLLLQLQIQELLPKGETQIERPFQEIHRVSDLVWEKEKIAFEIQCSPIYPKEVKQRIEEYRSMGYAVIWILDDRSYNKKILRPSEGLIRRHNGYFASFRRETPSLFYDQFEIFSSNRRLTKSRKLLIDLHRSRSFPAIEIPHQWPLQIAKRAQPTNHYFCGDLLDRALKASLYRSYGIALENWAALEKQYKNETWKRKLKEEIRIPFLERLNAFLTEGG